MIGSHNSISYYKPVKFWQRIFLPWARCQNKTLQEQYDLGVRYFDIRVKLIDGYWHFVHNQEDFGYIHPGTIAGLFNGIFSKETETPEPIYLRILLDERKTPDNPEQYKVEFIELLSYISNQLNSYIHIDEARVFWDWSIINDFSEQLFMQYEYHVSLSGKWYEYIFGTKLFAMRNNSKKFDKDIWKDNGYSVALIDYIQY